MDDIREQLLRKAYLYADTSAYEAGVEAALAAMTAAAKPITASGRDDSRAAPHEDGATILSLNG